MNTDRLLKVRQEVLNGFKSKRFTIEKVTQRKKY